MGQALPQTVDKSKVTAPRKPSSSVSFRQPEYSKPSKHQPKKPVAFEDNLSLSEEEEDIMLAQCIKSGMPKVRIDIYRLCDHLENKHRGLQV